MRGLIPQCTEMESYRNVPHVRVVFPDFSSPGLGVLEKGRHGSFWRPRMFLSSSLWNHPLALVLFLFTNKAARRKREYMARHETFSVWHVPNLILPRLLVPKRPLSSTQLSPFQCHKVEDILFLLRKTITLQQFLFLRVSITHKGRARWLGRHLFGVTPFLRRDIVLQGKDLNMDRKKSIQEVRERTPCHFSRTLKSSIRLLPCGETRVQRTWPCFYDRDMDRGSSCKSEAFHY